MIAMILLPTVAFAQAPRTFQELAADIVDIFNSTTAVLIVAGIVIYFYGVSTNILKFSDEGGEKVKAYFLWGIIILFVMVSIWGILQLLQRTLFGTASTNPATGQVQTSQDPFGGARFE